MGTRSKFLVFLLVIIFNSCTNSSSNNLAEQEAQKQKSIVIENVNIIPMTIDNKVIEGATVLIDDQKIISINEAIPSGATVIDGTGKWLIPGLMDMHVHTNADINFRENAPTQGATFFMDTQDVMTPYVANGVTTIFDLGSRVEHFGQRNEIAKGAVIGPRMALTALIDGKLNNGRFVETASDARQAVRSAKAEGYNFIKLYSSLNIESFKATVDEANKQGLKVVGHIPNSFKGKIEEAFVPHFDLVAHAEEFSKQTKHKTKEDAQYFAQLAKENETWLIPNMIVMVCIGQQSRSLDDIRALKTLQYVPPILQDKWLTSNQYNKRSSPEFIAYIDTLIDFQKELVKAFKEAGVPMLAGTDAGTSGLVSGFSLHDELELMVEAGLSTEETLLAATRLPAEWLGINNIVGTVEKGKYADLILLNANPLEEISNSRDISGVFVNGLWLDRKKIDQMLANLAERNAASKGQFEWQKRREY